MLCPYAAYHFVNIVGEVCKELKEDSKLDVIMEKAHSKFRKSLEYGNISENDIEGEMIRLDAAIEGMWKIHCKGKEW